MRTALFVVAAASLSGLAQQAHAADAANAAKAYVWSGFYLGAFGGVAAAENDYDFQLGGASGAPLSQNEVYAVDAILSALDIRSGDPFEGGGSLVGGVVGYDQQFGPWVIGAYADFAFTDVDTQIYTDMFGTQGRFNLGLNYVGTVQAKLGYAFDPALVYLHGGYAYGETEFDFHFNSNNALKETYFTDGYVVGVGAELPISPRVSLSADYSFMNLGPQSVINGQFEGIGVVLDQEVTLHQLRLGFNFRPFGVGASISDQPLREWQPAWAGFYVGGYAGIGASELGYDYLSTPDVGPTTISPEELRIAAAIGNLLGGGSDSSGDVTATGAIAGAQLGYDHRFGNMVLGAYADITYVGQKTDIRASYEPGEGRYDVGLDYVGTLQARTGMVLDRTLLFVHGGYAFGQTNIDLENEQPSVSISRDQTKHGYVVGAGAEYALSEQVSVVADYSFINLGDDSIVDGRANGDTLIQVDESAELHKVQIGLNFRFGH